MLDYLIKFSLYITNIFSPYIIAMLCIFMLSTSFIYLNIKKIKYREILSINCPKNIKGVIIISISVFISIFLSLLIKQIFKISRPENMLVFENGYSFPSVHTAVMFSFSTSILFVLFKYFKNNNYKFVNYLHSILFTSIALLISLTRTFLQVHRYEDLFFGLILGIFSSLLSIKIYYTIVKYVDFKILK